MRGIDSRSCSFSGVSWYFASVEIFKRITSIEQHTLLNDTKKKPNSRHTHKVYKLQVNKFFPTCLMSFKLYNTDINYLSSAVKFRGKNFYPVGVRVQVKNFHLLIVNCKTIKW